MQPKRKIGLAVDAVGTYGRGIIRGVARYCRANPNWIITEEPRWSFAKRPDLKAWDVDGIVCQIFDADFQAEILTRGIPAVNVSNILEEHEILTVLPDDGAVGKMAADYLASLGVREFGFVWGGNADYAKRRLTTYRKQVESLHFHLHECNSSQQDMGEWLLKLPKPAGILGCNDEWAHRLLKAARQVGVKVPDDIAILGVDDDELLNDLISPSLSSVSLPIEQIGYEAAERLESMLAGNKEPVRTILFPPLRVVTRQSTEMLSLDDVEVGMALRFIRENASRPIHVDDVQDHVPLSRRSLERRFRDALGRSISEEIRHAHVERAKKLLVTTDLSIKQVAASAGFENTTRMGIVFQKEVGESPSVFRSRSGLDGRRRAEADAHASAEKK